MLVFPLSSFTLSSFEPTYDANSHNKGIWQSTAFGNIGAFMGEEFFILLHIMQY